MESRFDALAKALAQSGSRREALRRLGGAAAAVALTAVGISCAPDDLAGPSGKAKRPLFGSGGRCKKNDHKCRENDECCSGLCNPLTGVCACSAGSVECPVSGQCVPACGTFQVLNPDTCTCECAPASVACGTGCCAPGQICCNGVCTAPCGTSGCCPTGQTCCGGTCRNLANDPNSCGTCGTICPAPYTSCQGGFCTCPSQQLCSTLFFGTLCCFPGQICNSFSGCI